MKDFYQFMFAVRNARKRAGRKESEFDLTDADVRALWERCGGRCEITGLEFDFSPMEAKHQRRPYAPSLDRRDNSKGYSFDNVRVVCIAVNIAMNQWGEAVLMRVAAALFHNGAFGKIGRQDMSPVLLPSDVRMYRGKKRITYATKVRHEGREIWLGTFHTVEQALEKQLAWARENCSLKVIRNIYSYTKDDVLLNEINELRRKYGGVADGARTQTAGTPTIPLLPPVIGAQRVSDP